MTLVLNGTHFTMQFELYVLSPKTKAVIDSYAVSPQVSLETFLKLIQKYEIEQVIFIGKIAVFKEIEQYYKNNNSEVQIIWQ